MANKQQQSRRRLRMENRQSSFIKDPTIWFLVGCGLIVGAVLVYSAYNQWIRPLPGLTH